MFEGYVGKIVESWKSELSQWASWTSLLYVHIVAKSDTDDEAFWFISIKLMAKFTSLAFNYLKSRDLCSYEIDELETQKQKKVEK